MPSDVFALPTTPPAVGIRFALHELTSADLVPGTADMFMPTSAALRCFAAANAIVAQDVTDPARQQAFPGPAPDLLPGGIASVVFVQIDHDAPGELAWVAAAVTLAADLRRADRLPPRATEPTVPRG